MNTPTPRTDAFSIIASPSRNQYLDFAEQLEYELTAVTEQRDRLAEALRKAISWGDSASHHILHRQDINWTYLNEAKEALQSLTTNSQDQSSPSDCFVVLWGCVAVVIAVLIIATVVILKIPN